jgi:hypothetical protein
MSIAAAASRARAGPATAWRRHLTALAIAAGAVLMLLAGDAAHMATIWWTSSTFNHCLLIVPIIAWLVWQRAPALAGLTPSVWPAGLAVVGAGIAGVDAGRCGWRVAVPACGAGDHAAGRRDDAARPRSSRARWPFPCSTRCS